MKKISETYRKVLEGIKILEQLEKKTLFGKECRRIRIRICKKLSFETESDYDDEYEELFLSFLDSIQQVKEATLELSKFQVSDLKKIREKFLRQKQKEKDECRASFL